MSNLSPNYLPYYYTEEKTKKGVKLEQHSLMNKRTWDLKRANGEIPNTSVWPYGPNAMYDPRVKSNHRPMSYARYKRRHQPKQKSLKKAS